MILFLVLFSLLFTPAFGGENLFPELDSKKDWDRGCEDWPVKLFPAGIEANPALAVDKGQHDFRFRANLVLERLRGESLQQLRASIESLVREENAYKQWVIPGINEKPDGKTYFVEVENLEARKLSDTSFDLFGPFAFHLLWVKKKGTTTIQFRVFEETPPNCAFFAGASTRKLTVIRFRMIPRPDLLDYMIGEVWILDHDHQVDLRMRAVLRPYGPIFELMPLPLIESEMKARAQRILENLIEFRRNRVLKK